MILASEFDPDPDEHLSGWEIALTGLAVMALLVIVVCAVMGVGR